MLKKSQKYLQIALFAHLTLIINSAVAAEANWRIVNYWSEWCAPCRIEIPMFNALFNDLKASNVSIVGINFDEDPRDITLDIAEELGVEFPTLTIEEVEELALRPPDVMPTTYLLSPTNEVVAKLVGMQSREDILNQLAALGIAVQIN
jgi:thiol-disulfide isomerase/thioredoxin|tara:strand:+ start:1491 stop:1934 length:444 start_codon:yes stop_codon:yes gene_type:complete